MGTVTETNTNFWWRKIFQCIAVVIFLLAVSHATSYDNTVLIALGLAFDVASRL